YWGADDEDVAKAALFLGGFTALLLFGLLNTVFNLYLWRVSIGTWMFRFIGLAAPPNFNGEYPRSIEVYAVTDQGPVVRTDYYMRIWQTWEQISLFNERKSEAGGLVRLHSDMASIRVGMMSGVETLRFVYTFEENLPRREGVGTMARQFSGAATLEFRRDGEAWRVLGHFFDDVGRSGQITLRQGLAGFKITTVAPSPQPAATSEQPRT